MKIYWQTKGTSSNFNKLRSKLGCTDFLFLSKHWKSKSQRPWEQMLLFPPEVFGTRDFCSSHRTRHSLSGKSGIGCFLSIGFCQPIAGIPDELCQVLWLLRKSLVPNTSGGTVILLTTTKNCTVTLHGIKLRLALGNKISHQFLPKKMNETKYAKIKAQNEFLSACDMLKTLPLTDHWVYCTWHTYLHTTNILYILICLITFFLRGLRSLEMSEPNRRARTEGNFRPIGNFQIFCPSGLLLTQTFPKISPKEKRKKFILNKWSWLYNTYNARFGIHRQNYTQHSIASLETGLSQVPWLWTASWFANLLSQWSIFMYWSLHAIVPGKDYILSTTQLAREPIVSRTQPAIGPSMQLSVEQTGGKTQVSRLPY